jgi:hypothetical protein
VRLRNKDMGIVVDNRGNTSDRRGRTTAPRRQTAAFERVIAQALVVSGGSIGKENGTLTSDQLQEGASLAFRERLRDLERAEVEADLADVPAPAIELHPNLPESYRKRIQDLKAMLLQMWQLPATSVCVPVVRVPCPKANRGPKGAQEPRSSSMSPSCRRFSLGVSQLSAGRTRVGRPAIGGQPPGT